MSTERPLAPSDPESVGELLDKIAHDTRTPLAALLMWTRLLRAGQAPSAAALDAIERNAVALSKRIDDLQPIADRLRGVRPEEPATLALEPTNAPPAKAPKKRHRRPKRA